MKNRTTKNTLNKFILLLIVSLFLGFNNSCDSIIGSINELPDEQDDEASNPRDPSNDAFILPNIEFINGDFSFDTPFTINQRNLTLEWDIFDQTGTTIDFDYTFQYRYAHSSESLAGEPFIDLNTERSFSISNLRETFESDAYNFEILASFSSETVTKDTTFTGQFYVDAFTQRGFLFNPEVIDNGDGSFTTEIFVDEIQESDDLKALSLVVQYDNSQLTVAGVNVPSVQGTFLYREGAEVISFVEYGSNTITVDLGVAGSNLAPYSGGGKICEITFNPTSSFFGSSLSILSSSLLRSSIGDEIEVLAVDQIEVSP